MAGVFSAQFSSNATTPKGGEHSATAIPTRVYRADSRYANWWAALSNFIPVRCGCCARRPAVPARLDHPTCSWPSLPLDADPMIYGILPAIRPAAGARSVWRSRLAEVVAFSRSSTSPGCVGCQPVRSRVSVLGARLSAPGKQPASQELSCILGSHGGRATPSPPRAATACHAAVWCSVVYMPA